MNFVGNVSRRHFLQLSAGTLGAALGGASLLSGCGGGGSTVSPATVTTPKLASVTNFRDTGGPNGAGYTTSSGAVMKKALVYRSNALTLSAADLATVNTLGITQVYDLRRTSEVSATPDVLPTGAAWQDLNVLADETSTTATPTTGATAVAYMEEIYQQFVTLDSAITSYRALFTDLATNSGNQLFHCTAGKDRTGWGTAILHTILGLPQEIIFADYLLTNTYNATTIAAQVAAAQASGGQNSADMIAAIQGVQSSYLQAAFDQVTTTYGSMSAYLSDGLQLGQSTLTAIKQRMLA